MTDLVVSRIQNRRGRQVDLPQPLRPGEFGWCVDTGRLFIGGRESETPSGVQVYAGLYTEAQSMLDNQFLQVDVSGVTGFDLNAFRNYMSNAANLPNADSDISPTNPEIPNERIQYDSVSQIVYIGFTVDQSDSGTGPGSSIDEDTDGYQVDIANFDAGITVTEITQLSFTVNSNGNFNTSTHDSANAIAKIMNELNGTVAIATTKLNVEVLTEFSSVIEDQIFDPVAFTLPSSGSFIDFPAPGIEYTVTESDAIIQDYSVHLNDSGNYYNSTGSMKLTVIPDVSQAALADEFIDSESPSNVGTIEFRAVFESPDIVKVQYKHDFPASVIFKAISRRWLSF